MQLQVVVAGDAADADALAESALALSRELADLDVDEVAPAVSGEAPPGAKGVELMAIGALVVKLAGSTGLLRQVVDTVRDWVTRNAERSVKLQVDGDVLEITGATSAERKAVIDAWLQRHGGP